jgi:hypothetical protein
VPHNAPLVNFKCLGQIAGKIAGEDFNTIFNKISDISIDRREYQLLNEQLDLTLALFMLGIGTDDHYPTTTFDDAALFTDFFNRRSNFHAKWGAILQVLHYSQRGDCCKDLTLFSMSQFGAYQQKQPLLH